MKTDVEYRIRFDMEGTKKEFRVSRDIYNRMNEGEKGVLEYNGKEYIEFEKKGL